VPGTTVITLYLIAVHSFLFYFNEHRELFPVGLHLGLGGCLAAMRTALLAGLEHGGSDPFRVVL